MKGKAKKGLLRTLTGNIAIIVMAGLIGGLLMYYIESNTVEEKYESTVKLFVSNSDGDSESSVSAESELLLAEDCGQLVRNRAVMTRVIAGLDLQQTYSDMRNITAEELASMVSVCVKGDTRIIYVTIRDVSPARARGLADAVGVASVDYFKRSFDVKNAQIIETAGMPDKPICHSYVKDIAIGAVAGVALAILASVIVFAWDKRLKSKADIERYAGLAVLASIPVHDEVVVKSSKAGKSEGKAEADSDGKASQEKAKEE